MMDKAKTLRYAKGYDSLRSRVQRIKPLIIKRKSAFTVYEWMEIRDTLKLIES